VGKMRRHSVVLKDAGISHDASTIKQNLDMAGWRKGFAE
jgi:hypothetical protein